tara:strand:+ start:301 stop:516 length:216 start_codon:yes stop_codon:yes gene_type:complete
MGHYAESQQPADTDYGLKTCPDCDGLGKLEDGYDEDGEPCLSICNTCHGNGEVEKDVEDETSDQWDAQCEE